MTELCDWRRRVEACVVVYTQAHAQAQAQAAAAEAHHLDAAAQQLQAEAHMVASSTPPTGLPAPPQQAVQACASASDCASFLPAY